MAQSIVKHPRSVVRELRRDYQITDEKEIVAFLERYPTAAPLLFDIRTNIRKFFGEDPVRLDMFYDPEWPEDGPKLVVNIETPAGPMEALNRIHKFDDEWWIEKHKGIDAPLLVTFELARRV